LKSGRKLLPKIILLPIAVPRGRVDPNSFS